MAVVTSIYRAANSTLALLKSYLAPDSQDNHTNEETIHDPLTDIDADVFNRILAGLSEVAKRTRPGNLIAIPFELAGLAASATATAQISGWAAQTIVRLFKDATLVGITAEYDSAIVSGTLTVQPTIGGTDSDLTLLLDNTAQQNRAHQITENAGADDAVDASAFEAVDVDIVTAALNPAAGQVNGLVWFSVGEEEDL